MTYQDYSRWSPLSTGLALGLTLGLMVGGMGCEDDPPGSGNDRPPVFVEVRDVVTDLPQEGVKLVMMDVERNLPVADPVLSDATGSAQFTVPGDGQYSVLAYPGGGIGIYHQPGSFNLTSVKSRGSERHILGPDKTPPLPNVQVTILTLPHAVYEDVEPRISGEIVDVVTGELLNQTFVSLPSHVSGYVGNLDISDDITAADGQFLVADIPFALDLNSGNIFQILPLIFVRDGYLPLVWFHEPPNGNDNTDITGVRIELQPLLGTEMGVLTGVVWHQEQPVSGLRVGVSPLGAPPGKAPGNLLDKSSGDTGPDILAPHYGVGLVDQVSVTDDDGRFRFENLPAGGYYVHPGYPPDDAYAFFNQEADRIYVVGPDSTTETQTLAVLQTIFAVEPRPGVITEEAVRVFKWTAVAGADSYRVYLDRGVLGTFSQTEYTLPEGEEIDSELHIWFVEARREDGTPVGMMEQYAPFGVR